MQKSRAYLLIAGDADVRAQALANKASALLGAGEVLAPEQLYARYPGNVLILHRKTDTAGRPKGVIDIDEVRRVIPFFTATAYTSSVARLVVIDDAQHLSHQAAAALLKSLEEPPPRCSVLLAASGAGRLSAPLRSRCITQVIRTEYPVAALPSDILSRPAPGLFSGELKDADTAALSNGLLKAVHDTPSFFRYLAAMKMLASQEKWSLERSSLEAYLMTVGG